MTTLGFFRHFLALVSNYIYLSSGIVSNIIGIKHQITNLLLQPTNFQPPEICQNLTSDLRFSCVLLPKNVYVSHTSRQKKILFIFNLGIFLCYCEADTCLHEFSKPHKVQVPVRKLALRLNFLSRKYNDVPVFCLRIIPWLSIQSKI